MAEHLDATIDYVEFPATDLIKTKAFYEQVFGWVFTDYGPTYTAFSRDQAGRDGGFTTDTPKVAAGVREGGGALIVLYADNLEATQQKIETAGGAIVQPIFDFPGGRRFHFTDPSGNELAVWALAVEE